MRSCDERQRGSWVRPCDVARGSEVCGTLEDLIVRVVSSPLDTTLHIICCVSGARGALCVLAGAARGSTQRVRISRARVPNRVCVGARTPGACTGDEGHRVDRTRGSDARCARATCAGVIVNDGTWGGRAAG